MTQTSKLSWKRSKLDLPTQIKDDSGRLIAVAMVSAGKFSVSQAEAEAHANLIAAAPDLLKELTTLIEDYRRLVRDYSDSRERDGWDAFDCEDELAAPLAAIAKAKGAI